MSRRASAPTRHSQQFNEQPKDPRQEACHTKEGIPAIPRAKPEGESQAGNQPMRRRLGRRDYSSLKTAGTRTGIPDHSCPPLLPLPHPPPPPASVHRALGSQQVDPWAREGGGGKGGRGGRGVTWTTAESQLIERPLGGWKGQYLPSQTTLIKSVTDSARSL